MSLNTLKYNTKKTISLLSAMINKNGVNVFWWNERMNFGDLLMPELLQTFHLTPVHRFPDNADIVGVGSLLQMLPADYSGMILGTGVIDGRPLSLPQAQFLAVRGELSKKALSLDPSMPTGDLGLIADRLIQGKLPEKKYSIGLIPHYADKGHPWVKTVKELYGDKCNIIDVEASAKSVVKEVALCDAIISSSLHGIIVADSLAIKNTWVELSDAVVGAGFKFRDYGTSIDHEQSSLLPDQLTTTAQIDSSFVDKSSTTINNKKLEINGIIQKHILVS